MNIEDKVKELGYSLPPPPKPVGSYHPVVYGGKVAYLSGQIAKQADGKLITGKLGTELTLVQGQDAARAAALNVLSIIHHLIKTERFERILRMVGYVQTQPDFSDIPQVMNAASDLLISVLGEKGVHARSAVGMSSLPLNSAVEIEATILIR